MPTGNTTNINGNQITINVSDILPPENFATVDSGSLIGTVYTKAQDNEWREGVEAAVTAGIKGVAKPDDVITTTGFYRMLANTADTYTNYLDLNDAPIVVTDADLNIVSGIQRNEVIFEITNGVAEKKVYAKVGNDGANGTATIPQWVAGSYSPDAMVIYDFVQYITPTGALSTDVPGVSNKWIKIGSVDLGSDLEFRNKIDDKAMSPAQLFNEVIGDFNFSNMVTVVDMMLPFTGFDISANGAGKLNSFA